MIIDLTNKHALVCGASEGIGRSIAQSLAQSGARVTVCARRKEALENVVHDLVGGPHFYLVADMDEPQQMADRVADHISTCAPIDIIVNNAGGPPGGSMEAAQAADFHVALNRLLIAGHLVLQTCLPHMKQRGYGRIINVISTSVRQPIDNLGVSNTTRAATAAWAKTWSKELAPFGITMNSVLPGATRTGRLEDIIDRTALRTERTKVEVEKSMLAEIPAGRFATPEEIAHAVTFLASEQASYITGIHLSVDGGRTKSLL